MTCHYIILHGMLINVHKILMKLLLGVAELVMACQGGSVSWNNYDWNRIPNNKWNREKKIGMVQKNPHPAGVVAERKIVDDVQFKQTMLVAGPCDKSSMTRADPCCLMFISIWLVLHKLLLQSRLFSAFIAAHQPRQACIWSQRE